MRYTSLISMLFAFALVFPASALAGDSLDRDQIEELVLGKTVSCRKVKDDSTCATYFDEEGNLARLMKESGKRKDGRWFLDDSDRLCILWNGKIKPLCLVVKKTEAGEYHMIKRDKHVSTITATADGNTEGL